MKKEITVDSDPYKTAAVPDDRISAFCILLKSRFCLIALDTLSRFSAILYKGDNYCDFLFALQHTKSLFKMGLL